MTKIRDLALRAVFPLDYDGRGSCRWDGQWDGITII
jgi:hypothetical protein